VHSLAKQFMNMFWWNFLGWGGEWLKNQSSQILIIFLNSGSAFRNFFSEKLLSLVGIRVHFQIRFSGVFLYELRCMFIGLSGGLISALRWSSPGRVIRQSTLSTRGVTASLCWGIWLRCSEIQRPCPEFTRPLQLMLNPMSANWVSIVCVTASVSLVF